MLDDIYILQDYAIIVNNKILNIDTSCVIRRIVTYHYMVLVEVKITHMKLITKNKRKEEGDKDSYGDGLDFLMMKRKKTESGML